MEYCMKPRLSRFNSFKLIILVVCLLWRVAKACDEGFWGSDCQNLCHCHDGPEVCSAPDGRCVSGGCRRGYTGSPFCQTPCPDSTFGRECAFPCRCPPDDQCDHVNGLCSSGECLPGWDGPSCQLRMPTLAAPPTVSATFLSHVIVTWRPWTAGVDPGEPPVSEYRLQYRLQADDDTTWRTAIVLSADASPEPTLYTATVNDLTPRTYYYFRVDVARSDDGKTRPYYPGPVTEPIKTCAAPSGLPLDVAAERVVDETGTRQIIARWTPAPEHSSNCDVIAAHQLVLDYRDDGSTRNQATVSMPHTSFSFPDTLPGVAAQIHFQAVNDAGQLGASISADVTGDTSGVQVAPPTTTLAPPSSDVRMRGRTDTRLDIDWPPTDGALYHVTVSLEKSFTTTTRIGQVHQLLTLASPTLTLQNLEPASLYSILISSTVSSMATPTLPSYSVLQWTLPAQPPPPAPPIVRSVTNNGALLSLTPEEISTGPLSGYQIVVEKVDANIVKRSLSNQEIPISKRSTDVNEMLHDLMNYTAAMESGKSAYITAELGPIHETTNLSIGDNNSYNGYHNVPLQPNTRYRLWHGVVSRLDGATMRTFVAVPGDTAHPEYTLQTYSDDYLQSGAATGGRDSAGLIAGLLLFFLLLLLIIFLVCVVLKKYPGTFEEMRDKLAIPRVTFRKRFNHREIWKNTFDSRFLSTDRIDLEETGPEIHVKTNPSDDDQYYIMKRSNGVFTRDLSSHYDRLCADESRLLSAEFGRFPTGPVSTTYVGTAAQNTHRNRNTIIMPFDRNRLKLRTEYDGDNDYINASLVSYEGRSFIVTQCPREMTRNDFWRMIWDNKTSRVISLINVDENSGSELQYWPSAGRQTYGSVTVEALQGETLAYCTIRSFQLMVESMNEVRYLRQFQYRCWSRNVPDGVLPFLEFLQRCHRNVDPHDIPVVQCVYGGGRSGVLVALSILLQQGASTGRVDVTKCVTHLRLERMGLVKSLSQYGFIHQVLIEAFSYSQTLIPRQKFRAHYDSLVYIVQGQQTKLAWEFQALQVHTTVHSPDTDPFKSPAKTVARQVSVTAKTVGRQVSVTDSHSSPGSGLELMVSLVDSYTSRDMFLCISSPSESQTVEFWGRVVRDGCNIIVRLVNPDERHFPFWPDVGDVKRYGDVTVHHVSTVTHSGSLVQRELRVSTEVEGVGRPPLDVALFQLCWPDGAAPPSVSAMVDLLTRVTTLVRATHSAPYRMVVTCKDGETRCGAFVVIWNLMQKLDMEGEVDVLRTCKHLRNQLLNAIASEGQYKFIYRTVKEYLRGTTTLTVTKSAGTLRDNSTTAGFVRLGDSSNTTRRKSKSFDPRDIDQRTSPGSIEHRTSREPVHGSGSPRGTPEQIHTSGTMTHRTSREPVHGRGSPRENPERSHTSETMSPLPDRHVTCGDVNNISHNSRPYTSTPSDSFVWKLLHRREQKPTPHIEEELLDVVDGDNAVSDRLRRQDRLLRDAQGTPSRPRDCTRWDATSRHRTPDCDVERDHSVLEGQRQVDQSDTKYSRETDDTLNNTTKTSPGGAYMAAQRRQAKSSPSKTRRSRMEQIGRTLPLVGGHRFYVV